MNIKKAKEQVKDTIRAYLEKDEFGNYVINASRQRPIFLLGAPGIGKTAIMEQIAEELDIGLVSYSMTHHTRQSAIGLPFITQRIFDGNEYSVTEYTMSEIIASVYDMREQGGIREGILFLDEINCVSETLAPAMLEFLQFKIFGGHRVPEGWVVITAGNPPEFNNSVREFDVVTMDRLKIIEVEADYDAWREYAFRQSVHNAIIRYLDIKKSNFFSIETTVEGKQYVTPRGWEDLSDMLKLYETIQAKVDIDLISQYMHNHKIARDFSIYYDLYFKYKSDYQIEEILSGKISSTVKEKVDAAPLDEKLSLVGLLIDAVTLECRALVEEREVLIALLPNLKKIGVEIEEAAKEPGEIIHAYIDGQKKHIERIRTLGRTAKETFTLQYKVLGALEEYALLLTGKKAAGAAAFAEIKVAFNGRSEKLSWGIDSIKDHLEHMFVFLETVFGNGQEILVAVTELTANYFTSKFITEYGCPKYFEYNKNLLFYERGLDILRDLKLLETL
jgi:MoxR-like ATPase